MRCASGRWSGTTRMGCCSAAADFMGRGLMAMRRSLCEQMNLRYAGWGNKQAGTHTVPNGAKNVNGASCKWRTRRGRDLFRERMWYCADKDARRLHERAGESADFRANVLHPGGTGWEVRAEAREVRGREDARDR